MNDRSGLLTLAVYLTATMLIVVVAFMGIFRYGAMARVAALSEVPHEPTSELAGTGLELPPESVTSDSDSNTLDQQRVRVLQLMLSEKTERLQEQDKRIEQLTQEISILEREYEEALQTVAMLLPSAAPRTRPAETDGTTADKAQAGGSQTAPNTPETEGVLPQAMQETLLSDLESLQDELTRARAQMAELQTEADRQSANQLRDVLALETAAAAVLLRIGRDAIPALTNALQHADPIVRRWAATALGSFGPDAAEASGALAEALSDSDPSVRRAVAAALDAIER